MKKIIEINFKESDNYTAIKSVIDTLQNNLNTENVDKWFILPKLKCELNDEYPDYDISITSLTVGIKLKDSSDMTYASLISKDVLPYVSSITEIDSDFMETFKAVAFARFNEYVNLIADTYKGLYEYKLFDDDKLVLSNINYTEYPYLSMILNDFDKFAHAMAEYKLWEKDQLYDENDNAYRKSYIKRQENVLNGLRFFD